jgi:hypothetical protein
MNTIKHGLQAYLDRLADLAPAQHPDQTPYCLSFPELDDHVAGRSPIADRQKLRHLNVCGYCQLNADLFKKELGRPPWWEQYAERWQDIKRRLLEPLQVKDWPAVMAPPSKEESSTWTRGYPRLVKAVQFTAARPARVELAEPPRLKDRHLSLRVNVYREGAADRSLTYLTLVALDGGELTPIRTFELLDLREQLLRTTLPAEVADREEWRDFDPSLELPFGFVLQIGGESHSVAHTNE